MRSSLAQIRELRAVIADLVREHGVDDSRTLIARLTLADLYQSDLAFDGEQQRWENLAYEELLHVYYSRRRTLGSRHADTVTAQNRLLLRRECGGDLEAVAWGVLEDLAASRERTLGPHHPETLRVLEEHALRLSVPYGPNHREGEREALWDRIIRG
jgi:hypothetical protein